MPKAQEKRQEIGTVGGADELNPSFHLSGQEDERTHDLKTAIEIAELLEVALHTVLYIRQIYPTELFERRVKLGIPVFQCIDPSIRGYISEVVKAITEEIIEGSVARVIITIHRSDTLLEKFIFSFEYRGSSDDATKAADTDILPQPLLVQRQARGMLLKLNAIDATLLPLEPSDELSFSVIMQLREEEGAFRIPDDDRNFDVVGENADEKGSGLRIREPALVHIIRFGRLSVYLHVQESKAKEQAISISS